MQELRDKHAVVTGAAGGIGYALAEALARAGMRVLMADVDEARLAAAVDRLRAAGAQVAWQLTDVARADDVDALARRARAELGAVHVLCNNAGVASDAPLWETTLEEWRWILGVNLWGVIHGIRAFVPGMLAHGEQAHVVNTASIAGLVSEPGLGAYKASKHAVVSISETLRHELARARAPIGVSVLCPGFVRTGIADPPRARVGDAHRRAIESGMEPGEVARLTVEAICASRFWVLTHPEWSEPIRRRALDVVEGRDPARRESP